MKILTEIDMQAVSGGGGWSAHDMGYATGRAIGSAINAASQTSYAFGVWLYDITH